MGINILYHNCKSPRPNERKKYCNLIIFNWFLRARPSLQVCKHHIHILLPPRPTFSTLSWSPADLGHPRMIIICLHFVPSLLTTLAAGWKEGEGRVEPSPGMPWALRLDWCILFVVSSYEHTHKQKYTHLKYILNFKVYEYIHSSSMFVIIFIRPTCVSNINIISSMGKISITPKTLKSRSVTKRQKTVGRAHRYVSNWD